MMIISLETLFREQLKLSALRIIKSQLKCYGNISKLSLVMLVTLRAISLPMATYGLVASLGMTIPWETYANMTTISEKYGSLRERKISGTTLKVKIARAL